MLQIALISGNIQLKGVVMMGFGINLKNILSRRDLTIKELSEITGISLNTLYSITKRDTRLPSNEILEKIANALEIAQYELLDFSDEYYIPVEGSAKYDFSPDDNKLIIDTIRNIEKLNDLGKEEAAKRVEELTQIEKYKIK